MTRLNFRRIFAYSTFFWLLIVAQTRPLNSNSTLTLISVATAPFDWSTVDFKSPAKSAKNEDKPYHINISGKQVTIKSAQAIKNILVWTSVGDRIIEQKDLNLSSLSFELNVKTKGYYIMIQLMNDKSYTEKL
ncbi:MAG TPA: hypothetical protein VLJ68_01175 [Chitinophagaceae bacterium]|nr:hypothetical protein [Chitinophagaceae bacterium]